MKKMAAIGAFASLLWLMAASSSAQAPGGLAKPELLRREVVQGMPKADAQEIRVLTATFQPGDRTVFHTHRSPVTVYVAEGQFTLELEGRPPVTLRTGEAYVEPPHVRMTGYNRSSTQPLKVVIFYVSEPGTPFLDVVR
jgi:quercetin dioxygenase-like cupin family protein